MAEVGAAVTPGSGELIDTFNVGSGAIGSGNELLRQVVGIGDPTTAADVATVKAASTPAATTDLALVVATHPSNTTNVTNPDNVPGTSTIAMSATTNAATYTVNGDATVGIEITGTWTGSLIFEGIIDNVNGTWRTINVVTPGASGTQASSITTTNGYWRASSAGLQGVRMRCSVTGTGTATVQFRGAEGAALLSLTEPLAAGGNLIGSVNPGNTANTTPWLTSDIPATAGGLSCSSFLSTAAVQSTAVKASAGQVYGLHFFNNTATIAYVRLYNQATAPASTDTANIVYRSLVPANTSGAGFVVPIPPGLAFATGIGLRVTAAVADNDTTALAANAILGNVFYK